MQEKLRHDAVSEASYPLSSKALFEVRKSLFLKFERAFFESKASLTSSFGDNKIEKNFFSCRYLGLPFHSIAYLPAGDMIKTKRTEWS